MNLTDIIQRRSLIAWQDSEKIPWNNPDFSRRMLESHLSQDHDWASRRHTIIDRHVRWIADRLPEKNAKILDLGCGPGFYTQRFAELGFSCIGVDFAPASIEYARKQAEQSGQKIEYVLQDIRTFTTDQTFDAILLTFGEFNVFKQSDAVAILKKASVCLKLNGFLLLEAHTFDAVKNIGTSPATWQAMECGVFSDMPHFCLQENFWDESASTATTRYFIVDAATSNVQEYGSSMKAYSDEEYRQMLHDADCTRIETLNAADWQTGDDFNGKLQTYIGAR
jgi:ubiquinone/menaquinone biosynthesis C-methylase UbiE